MALGYFHIIKSELALKCRPTSASQHFAFGQSTAVVEGQPTSTASLAAKLLYAPSTSVESKRLFSTASNITDERRSRLTAEKTEVLIFLKKNLPSC